MKSWKELQLFLNNFTYQFLLISSAGFTSVRTIRCLMGFSTCTQEKAISTKLAKWICGTIVGPFLITFMSMNVLKSEVQQENFSLRTGIGHSWISSPRMF